MLSSPAMKPQTRTNPAIVALPPLSAKQREVVVLLADNRTSKEIVGLLGISESAVNQRIELIRTRLGGIPRGEIARLYRQEFAREQTIAATFPPTWNKIQVQFAASSDESSGVEGPTFPFVPPGRVYLAWPGGAFGLYCPLYLGWITGIGWRCRSGDRHRTRRLCSRQRIKLHRDACSLALNR